MSVPTIVGELHEEEIVKIIASGDVSAALTSNGQVFTWGRTKGGFLEQGEELMTTTVSQTNNLVLPTALEVAGVAFK